ncbi:alpha/beta hydrolase [Sinobaca sp. H24]|uniref:alpha/beta hydrolase n=1 Tax=Sinobaca sp. H24 TaxID=2923376 RepID=UPI00207AA422|nr:alpha/beta hydrolase [Sinobaca sp. H24]
MASHDQLRKQMQEKETRHIQGNMEKIIKHIPDQEETGGLDPRVKEWMVTAEPDKTRRPLEVDDLEEIREHEGFPNTDIAPSISSRELSIELEDRSIPVRIYNEGGGKKPVMLYFHGGGFFSGNIKMVENPCKWLAQEAEAVVISVGYRLAPEHPFADGLNDCLEGTRWVWEQAEQLQIDTDNISLAGESAGANLALGVSELSLEEKWDIKHIALLYPLVDLADFTGEQWKIDQYKFYNDEALIRQELTSMQQSTVFIQSLYLQDLTDANSPLVSPILSENKHRLPPMAIVTSEYDYLKIQGQEYARQVAEAGVPVSMWEYKGMDHAFVDKLGYYPQAADALTEIASHFHAVRTERLSAEWKKGS